MLLILNYLYEFVLKGDNPRLGVVMQDGVTRVGQGVGGCCVQEDLNFDVCTRRFWFKTNQKC